MYVSLPSTGTTASAHALDAGFADAILALPQVKAVSSVRRITIESSRGRTELAAYGLNEAAREGFRFKQGAGTRSGLPFSRTMRSSFPNPMPGVTG